MHCIWTRRLTDRFTQRETLALPSDDDDDFARIKHRSNTDGERHPRHLGDVVVKEARVGEDGVIGERFDTGAGRK